MGQKNRLPKAAGAGKEKAGGEEQAQSHLLLQHFPGPPFRACILPEALKAFQRMAPRLQRTAVWSIEGLPKPHLDRERPYPKLTPSSIIRPLAARQAPEGRSFHGMDLRSCYNICRILRSTC